MYARFIPAYAGNSDSVSGIGCCFSVHPRLRGELRSRSRPIPLRNGSSPLTRGTLFGTSIKNIIDRFIPAYAGNSRKTLRSISLITVHPRLRGELPARNFNLLSDDGSSPLTRGTQVICLRNQIVTRFIPAYAGNSSLSNSTISEQTVHPRLRGELAHIELGVVLGGGSSPLTRGTQIRSQLRLLRLRFIPAYPVFDT